MTPALRVTLRITAVVLVAGGSALIYPPMGVIVLGVGVGFWGYRGGI